MEEITKFAYFLDYDNRLHLMGVFNTYDEAFKAAEKSLDFNKKDGLKALVTTCTEHGILIKLLEIITYNKECSSSKFY